MAFKSLYQAHATVTGGRDGGHGKTTDDHGNVDVNFSKPEALGGPGGAGTNPEQLFALGYAACFEGAISAVAAPNDADTSDVSIASTVEIGKTSSGLGLAVTLDVTLPKLDADQAAEIVNAAHQVCPYSVATRGNIEVTLIANGQPANAPAHA